MKRVDNLERTIRTPVFINEVKYSKKQTNNLNRKLNWKNAIKLPMRTKFFIILAYKK